MSLPTGNVHAEMKKPSEGVLSFMDFLSDGCTAYYIWAINVELSKLQVTGGNSWVVH